MLHTYILEWESNIPICDGDKLPRTMIVVAEHSSQALDMARKRVPTRHYCHGEPDSVQAYQQLTGSECGVIYDSASVFVND